MEGHWQGGDEGDAGGRGVVERPGVVGRPGVGGRAGVGRGERWPPEVLGKAYSGADE